MPPEKMHILIALTYYRPHYSGLTIHAEREARALAKRGHRVTVLTSRFDESLPGHEIKDGVEIVRPRVLFRLSKGVIMPSMPYWAWRLIKQVDVVHLHVPQFDAAPIAILSRMLAKPIVLTYHCDLRLPKGLIHYIANQVSNFMNHLTASLADVIVHNTRDYAEHSAFMQRYLGKLQPIYPPVEVQTIKDTDRLAFREKYHIKPDQQIIGMAARLATEKGVEFLAQALPIVMEKYPHARVLFVGPYQNIVGEEQYALRLKPLIEQLDDHWTFLGIISPIEMAAFFHECEVTILPSINSTESYGLVQVESITCGTPVVASDMPGVRVPILETGTGCIVPPANAADLAQGIISILDNPEEYRGRPDQFVQLSTPDSVAKAYESAFEIAYQKSAARRGNNLRSE